MTTWTLIILWGSHVYHGTAPMIENVPGFKNQAACVVAGDQVLKELSKSNEKVLIKVICVSVE